MLEANRKKTAIYQGDPMIKELVRLVYEERDFKRSVKYMNAHLRPYSLEYDFFNSRLFSYMGKMSRSIKINDAMVMSDHLDGLFYLLEGADDRLTLDLVNIGNDLRMRHYHEKSDAFFKAILKKQFEYKLVNRSTIVQHFINQSDEKQYLEIGVFVGHNYLQMTANEKLAVDPVKLIKDTDKFPSHVNFCQLPSDDFFESYEHPIKSRKADVIFIDGLHTYQQSLRDVINSLEILKEDGVIVMHDCYPKCKAAAHPIMKEAQQMEGYEGFWNGDVYKSVIWLRANRPDLEVCVIDADHGLGIVKRKENQSLVSLSDTEIEAMEYDQFHANKEQYLGLKAAEEFILWN